MKSFIGVLLAALLAGIAGFALSRWLNQAPETPFESKLVMYGTPRSLTEFNLNDMNGVAFTKQTLKGRWSVLFFGFTHCPDICPTTLSQLASVENLLSTTAAARAPRMVFVSVDPERDNAEKLRNYVQYFSKQMLAVTGDAEALKALTQQLGVMYAKVALGKDPNGTESYTVDHSSTLFLIDGDAQLRGLVRPPFEPKALARDLEKLTGERRP